jgi:hypothetical protein
VGAEQDTAAVAVTIGGVDVAMDASGMNNAVGVVVAIGCAN